MIDSDFKSATIEIVFSERASTKSIEITRDNYEEGALRKTTYYAITDASAKRINKLLLDEQWVRYSFDYSEFPDEDGTPNTLSVTRYMHFSGCWQDRENDQSYHMTATPAKTARKRTSYTRKYS